MSRKNHNPISWVPTVYFAMGLPFVVLNMVSVLMFKGLGIGDAQIALWTSLIMMPWTLKFLWSPFLEMFKTKKFFVVLTQMVTGAGFALVALALQLPFFFAICIALLAVIAFSGATHDVATDGVYMSELNKQDQAKYIGWQGAFYNIAKIVPLFLKAERSAGGLGLNEQQIGLYYGTYGAAAFVLGSLLAGYYISHRGLRRTLFSLCCIFNLPFVAYTLLAMYQPESGLLIGSAIVLEYFGYGFGFVGLTLFMMQQVAPGKHQMAHYAFASGIMNLGVMLPGTISGFVSDWLGYEAFFTFTLFATIPAFLITYFIPFTYADEKKQQ